MLMKGELPPCPPATGSDAATAQAMPGGVRSTRHHRANHGDTSILSYRRATGRHPSRGPAMRTGCCLCRDCRRVRRPVGRRLRPRLPWRGPIRFLSPAGSPSALRWRQAGIVQGLRRIAELLPRVPRPAPSAPEPAPKVRGSRRPFQRGKIASSEARSRHRLESTSTVAVSNAFRQRNSQTIWSPQPGTAMHLG